MPTSILNNKTNKLLTIGLPGGIQEIRSYRADEDVKMLLGGVIESVLHEEGTTMVVTDKLYSVRVIMDDKVEFSPNSWGAAYVTLPNGRSCIVEANDVTITISRT